MILFFKLNTQQLLKYDFQYFCLISVWTEYFGGFSLENKKSEDVASHSTPPPFLYQTIDWLIGRLINEEYNH